MDLWIHNETSAPEDAELLAGLGPKLDIRVLDRVKMRLKNCSGDLQLIHSSPTGDLGALGHRRTVIGDLRLGAFVDIAALPGPLQQ